MKILFVCHRFPYPPKRGGKIRPFNIIRHLAHAHDVTVCSLVRSDDEANEGAGLAGHCRKYEMVRVRDSMQMLRMISLLPTLTPSSFGYFESRELARRIAEHAARERFDLVFVHCSSVAHYVQDLRGMPKILDFGDMDSEKWREYGNSKPAPVCWGYALEGWKLRREEARLARRFDVCTATTLAERETLDSYGTGVATDWFPNGVDTEYFAPRGEGYDRDEIVFLGRMDYYPNQECMIRFCADVLPALQAKRPQLRLTIVGADPSSAIRRLTGLRGVSVTGRVPDVRPYLERAALMVAPLNIARGTQNKILEAMAAGVPVVTSAIAARGVDAVAPDHLLIAATPEEYVDAILSIVGDASWRARLAHAGRERMLSHHAWPQSMRRLDRIIERCVPQTAPTRELAVTSP